jgi:hypothetical protein
MQRQNIAAWHVTMQSIVLEYSRSESLCVSVPLWLIVIFSLLATCSDPIRVGVPLAPSEVEGSDKMESRGYLPLHF